MMATDQERELGVLSALYFPYLRGLAHELNNPLTGILGYAQLLGLGIGGEDGGEELKEIETCAVRCRDLVALLSRCSKFEEGEQHLNPEQIFGDVVLLAGPLAHRRSVHLDVRRAEGIPTLRGFPWKVRGALLGLLGLGLETDGATVTRLGLNLAPEGDGVLIEIVFPALEAKDIEARVAGLEQPDPAQPVAAGIAVQVLKGLGYQVAVEDRYPGCSLAVIMH